MMVLKANKRRPISSRNIIRICLSKSHASAGFMIQGIRDVIAPGVLRQISILFEETMNASGNA